MTTKAQKRAMAQIKHDAYMEEYRLSGLRALRKEQNRRREKLLKDWQENHDKNHNWKKLVPECPHCQLMLHKAHKEADKVEVSKSDFKTLGHISDNGVELVSDATIKHTDLNQETISLARNNNIKESI